MTRITRTRREIVKDHSKLETLISAYADTKAAMDALSSKLEREEKAIFAEMTKTKVDMFEHDFIKAAVVIPAGRETNIIDPQGYHDLCPDDKSFYGSVKVSITEARKVVPMRQLDTITTTIPAKPGERCLKLSALPRG